MSKIKLTGNASGTGVLTVTAPNTNTDRTISLPDTTDTLAVNSDVTNKLPLAGGTMSGNLIVNASVNAAGSGTSGGFHFADGNAMIYRDTNDMVFKLQGAEKIRLPSSGGITFNGDTAAANALDDYEEGTFNPSFGADNQGFTVGSTSGSAGKYIKIGSLVHFQMFITIQNSTPTSQGYRISGLPYANNSSAFAFFPIGGAYSGTNANAIHDKAQWRLDKNGTTFRFYIASENANKDGNQAWGGSNTEYSFDVSGTYMVTI